MNIPKIGSAVKVTCRYRDINYFSKQDYKEVITAGQIVPNDRWTDAGSFSITTGRPEYPVAIISLHNVVKIETAGKTLRAAIKKAAPKMWKVKSSNGKETYTVTNDNKSWNCTCPGYMYYKRCKHIKNKMK
jgi:hypothetical protein